jgi:uncharacterized membrane protein YhaH (DUF805 family)
MDEYINAILDFNDFSSRSTKKEYWTFSLIHIMILLSSYIISIGFGSFIYLQLLYVFFTFIPSISITVRRLHDIGKSGWWYFIIFIPFIGPVVLLCFTLLNSGPDNIYGHRKNQN